MRHHWLTRPQGTGFTSVVAHSDNEIKFYIFELFPRFASGLRSVDVVNVVQDPNGQGIDFTRGKRTGAEYLKARSAKLSQQIFANDAAC